MKKSLPITRWFTGIILILVLTATVNGQTTYTWNQTADAAFSTSTNWTPERTTPATTDILVFNNGGTYNVTGIATQTIGQLSVSNSTKVTLQAGAASTLTIAGGDGTDLSVAVGSELNVNTATALTITLSTGATGSISGSMTFAAGAHKLIAADASGITFNSGAAFTAGTSFSGNPFGSVTANSVIFASGSTYIYIAGSNPFSLSAPASVVVFQTGSLFKQTGTGSPAFSGRTYANYELDNSATTIAATGGSALNIDNITVTQGKLNLNLTGVVNVKGNLSVATGATFSFTPATAVNTITFAGTADQTITVSGTGTATFGANANVILTQNLIVNGPLTVNGSLNIADKTVSGTGSLTVASTGTVTTANQYGLDATNNLTVATVSLASGSSYVYNGAAVQVTGALLPSSIKNLTLKNASGVTLTADENISGTLTCTSGLLTLGTKNIVVASGGNIVGAYNSYVVTDGTGTVTHTLAASTNPLFGIGTTSGFAPVLCAVSAAGSGNVVAGSVKTTITNAPLHPDKVVQQEWIFNETVTGTDAGTVSFGWNNTTAAGTEFDVTKPVVFASWDAVNSKYNMDDVTPVAGTNGMYTITVALPTNIPNVPLLVGNKSAFLPDAPALIADATDNNVDNNITITFTEDAVWRASITAVSVNGTALTPTTDYTIASGVITLIPSGGNTLLTTAGTKTVSVSSTGYNDASVSQIISAGAINVTNSTMASSGALAPGATTTVTLTAKDNYSNPVTGYIFRVYTTVTAASSATIETYTVSGAIFSNSLTNIAVPATVNGVATFDIVMPAVIDGGDGIFVQTQLNDGTTSFGSSLSYTAPLVPTVSISVDNPAALVEEQMGSFLIYVTLLNDTFIDNVLSKTNFTLNNAPAGMSVEDVTYGSTTSATLTIYYDSTDFDVDITNFNITVAAAELTSGTSLTSNNLTLYAVVETAPVVTTNTAYTSLGMFAATWGGSVTSNGGEAVTESGICWNTSTNPTISSSKTTEGEVSTITGSMTGLVQATKYYVKAYATNSVGTSYGDEYSFTTNASYEDFVNFPEATTSYKTGTFVGRDGSTWSYASCAGTATTQITTPSPVFGKGKSPAASVTSGTIPNGIKTLGFKYVQSFSAAVNLDVFVNSILVANVTTSGESAMTTVHTITGIPVYVEGNVVIKFIQNNTNSGQVTIDDIEWTPYINETETVAVPRFSPLPTTSLGSQTVSLSCETAGAEIHYTLDGTDPTSASTLYTAALNLTTTTTIKAIAVKTGLTDSPVMTGIYTIDQIIEVANITALRAGTVGTQVYKLTGEAVLTFTSGYQKFIQDAGAGVLLYDASGIITTTYNQYDGITGITGHLADYNGVLEFVPIYNAAAASSTGNTVTPIAVTIAELNASPNTYESRIIKITGLTFADAGGSFAASTNYNITDGTNTTIFRTAFSTSDIIGTTIPTKADIVGLGTDYLGTAEIESRNLADMTAYSSAKAITGFAFNGLTPAVTGTINETAKTIAVTVPAGTNRTALVPTITVSANATVSPVSGVATDFTSTVNYTVTAQDGTTQAYAVTVSVGSGIDDEAEAKVRMYPIPATTEIIIENIETVKRLDIFNVAGVKISTIKLDDESFRNVPLNGYAPGLYFIRFTTDEGTFMKKFIKQ